MLIAGDEGKAVVGYIVAHALEATPGATIEIEGESFEVVGVMEMYPYPELSKAQPAIIALGEWISPDCAIFIPLAMMDDLFGGAGAPLFLAKAIILRSTAPDHPQVAAAPGFRKRHCWPHRFGILHPPDRALAWGEPDKRHLAAGGERGAF
ncbi:MAG: ABC transporter permease [Dehalococcoidia bacterium]|nr:hypothetical protein [Chloroflexota bacterium]